MNKNQIIVTDLADQPNIGKDTCARLIQVGIKSFYELKAVGTEQAFMLIHAIDPGACIQLLYGLEGAVESIPVNKLEETKKQELREFHRMIKKKK